jgi:hypothetical protein
MRKAALAALIALVCSMFLAFGREYAAEFRRRESLSPAEVAPAARPEGRTLSGERRDGAGLSNVAERTAFGERPAEAVGIAGHR